jgi:hypothetical protein
MISPLPSTGHQSTAGSAGIVKTPALSSMSISQQRMLASGSTFMPEGCP